MKFTCKRSALATAFNAVIGVIPTKSPKPVLQYALLTVRNGIGTLTGSDSEMSTVHDVGPIECSNCSTLLPAKRVHDILRELKCDEIEFKLDDSVCEMVGGGSKFRLPVADVNEYPEVDTFSEAEVREVPGSALRLMIRRTVFATDPESARYALGGVLFEFSKQNLTMVSTDSRRLSVISSSIPESKRDLQPRVVPQKALFLVERSIPDGESMVQIAFHNDSQIAFRMPHATIVSKLVEGRFPKYQDVVPKSHKVSLDLVAGQLHAVVRQSMIVTNEESRGVDFTFGNGMLTLSSEAADIGNSKIELPISYDGGEFSIRLDPRFVAEFLKVLAPETTVTWRLSDDESPCTLQTEDGSVYVLMPLSKQ